MTRSPNSSTPLSHRARVNKILVWVAGFSFVGFIDAAYLTAAHFLAAPVPCSITHGCETVLQSPYSMIGPVPLSLFGVGFYLAVLFLAIYIHTMTETYRHHHYALFVLTALGCGMSVVFELTQIFVIHAICQYCALSALASLGLFVCGIFLLRTRE